MPPHTILILHASVSGISALFLLARSDHPLGCCQMTAIFFYRRSEVQSCSSCRFKLRGQRCASHYELSIIYTDRGIRGLHVTALCFTGS